VRICGGACRRRGSERGCLRALRTGSRNLENIPISVLPGSGGERHDGLLGMNYLKNFRYHVDFARSVIEWGG